MSAGKLKIVLVSVNLFCFSLCIVLFVFFSRILYKRLFLIVHLMPVVVVTVAHDRGRGN